MNKNTIELIEKIKSYEWYTGDLKDLYEKTNNICYFSSEQSEQQFKLMLDLINEIDELVYDFEFLSENAQELNVKRADISQLLMALCEMLGDKIEECCREVMVVQKDRDYLAYSTIRDAEYIRQRLQRKGYDRYNLSDFHRVEDTDWYKVFVFTLLE